jgi:DNA modification methylase
MFYEIPDSSAKPLLIRGDAFEEIKRFKENTFDALIMDLPYLISFMGLNWDRQTTNTAQQYIDFFRECMRVLKPAGRLAIFTGSVNYDLFVNWARYAGFEVDSMLSWIYTSGMPHGVNVVKSLIKNLHRDICDPWDVDRFEFFEEDKRYEIYIFRDINGTLQKKKLSGVVPKIFYKYIPSSRSNKTSKDVLLSKLRYAHAKYFGYSVITYDFVKDVESPTGYVYRALVRNRSRESVPVTGPATEIMLKYDGFNSGLKPAIEPIANLIKPTTETSIISNIVKWGTGALNIKDCMIPLDGMQNVDIDRIIIQLKVKLGVLPSDYIKDEPVNISKATDDMKALITEHSSHDDRVDGTADRVFGNTSIRDRLNSGGGGVASLGIDKVLEDIKSMAFGTKQATEGSVFKDTTIPDRFNSGGGNDSAILKAMANDLKKQNVGFDGKTADQYVFGQAFNDSMHPVGNTKSDSVKEVVSFIKGSHEMYGSSGSGIGNYNSTPKAIKKDVDEDITTAKELTRTVYYKHKPEGVGVGKGEQEPKEDDLRELGKSLKKDLVDMTTRHDPSKHKGAFWGNADVPMDNKSYTIMTFLDKMLGRYPSNVITTESGILNTAISEVKDANYDKIFLVPKPSTSERMKGVPKEYQDELHKTIKPVRLMNHLVKLLSARGESNPLIGDFFMGSGTTIVAAKLNDIRAVGVEIDAIYFDIAKNRIRTTDVRKRLRLY